MVADALFLNLQGEEEGRILGETEWYVETSNVLIFRSSERGQLQEHVGKLEELALGK